MTYEVGTKVKLTGNAKVTEQTVVTGSGAGTYSQERGVERVSTTFATLTGALYLAEDLEGVVTVARDAESAVAEAKEMLASYDKAVSEGMAPQEELRAGLARSVTEAGKIPTTYTVRFDNGLILEGFGGDLLTTA
ncbi:hypothetical protein [Kitasatospora sp. NPDC089509]|uniref:hypothetical protein n=1 Tax=Kitasatospora sp. NPDC089509 TaxID=3364079 RepID=UPI00382572C8